MGLRDFLCDFAITLLPKERRPALKIMTFHTAVTVTTPTSTLHNVAAENYNSSNVSSSSSNSSITERSIILTLLSVALLTSILNLSLAAHHIKTPLRKQPLPLILFISFLLWMICQAIVVTGHGILPLLSSPLAESSDPNVSTRLGIASNVFSTTAPTLFLYVLLKRMLCIRAVFP